MRRMRHLAGAALVLGSLAMLPRTFAQETRSNTVRMATATMPRPNPGTTYGTPGSVPRGDGHYTRPDPDAFGSAAHGLWPVVVGNSDGSPIIEYQMPPR